ncbi:hypothetical protein KBZ94_40860 [Streptomyces sp. RM72]|uniref:hypothetical protein n=1 Tax=Streptomyces sp. RM72 TaxID=1115510 RepID=UPI001B36AF85|nr:hypothetical protein [Streptomyces sp. RM72]MBQ0891197.1 hypothetical protein [Streptomyces sp. RM72]
MPQMLRMPGKEALPPGPTRVFVAELHVHFREAGRPSLASIAATTGRLSSPVPVSRETIRRLLTGQTVSTWAKVDAVLRALCQLGGQDPDRRRWPEPEDRFDENDTSSCLEYLRRLWNDAVDGVEPEEAPAIPPPRPASGWGSAASTSSGGWGGTPSPPADDPWATQQTPAPTKEYPDEPPF